LHHIKLLHLVCQRNIIVIEGALYVNKIK